MKSYFRTSLRCWLRAAMVSKIVSLRWKSELLLLCRAVMSNPAARCGKKILDTRGRGLDIPWSPLGCQTWHWLWLWSLERLATLQVFFFTALASIVCGAVLTLGDALVLSSLGLHPWTS